MAQRRPRSFQVSDGSVFYTAQRKPLTLFFNDGYQLCDPPVPPSKMLQRLRTQQGKGGPNPDAEFDPLADDSKSTAAPSLLRPEDSSVSVPLVSEPLQQALSNAAGIAQAARGCVALFFYFVHPKDNSKPILCTQATGFFVSPSCIVTAHHNLSRKPPGYAFAECLAAHSANANMLTLRDREKFPVLVLDPQRRIDSEHSGPDEDPYTHQKWDTVNDFLFLSVDREHESSVFLQPISQLPGADAEARAVCALGYPIYLLHEKDIVDTFPDQIIVDVEDEINPTWRQELEARMNAEALAAAERERLAQSARERQAEYARAMMLAGVNMQPAASSSPATAAAAPPLGRGSTILAGSAGTASATTTPAPLGRAGTLVRMPTLNGAAPSPATPTPALAVAAPVQAASPLVQSPQAGLYPPNADVSLRHPISGEHVGSPAPSGVKPFVPGTLTVLIHEARSLWSAQLVTKQDPYVVVTMSKHKTLRYETDVVKSGGKDCVFPLQPFPFDVREPGLKVRLEVYNKNVVSSNDYLGRTYLLVDELINAPQRQWYRLGRDSNERTDAGELCISFFYLPIALVDQGTLRWMLQSQHLPPQALNRLALFSADMHNPPTKVDKESPIYATTKGMPVTFEDDDEKSDESTEKFIQGTLTIVVTGARNLYNPQLIGSLDPYCVVTMSKHKKMVYKTDVVKGGGRDVTFALAHFPFVVKEKGLKLRLEMYNKNLVSDDYVGRTYLWVDQLIQNPQHCWYRIGRDANEKTEAGEVSIAALFLPLDPDELADPAEIDIKSISIWTEYFLGADEALRLRNRPADEQLKAVNEKRKKDNLQPLEMPYLPPKPKFTTNVVPAKPPMWRVPTRKPGNSDHDDFGVAALSPHPESAAVRAVLRNLHRQFFYGYDRLVCCPGKLRWGEENDQDRLQHVTTTLTKGMAGGPMVVTQNPTSFVGIALGGYVRTKLNLMLSVFHPAFFAGYQRYVLPTLTGTIPSGVRQYLDLCMQIHKMGKYAGKHGSNATDNGATASNGDAPDEDPEEIGGDGSEDLSSPVTTAPGRGGAQQIDLLSLDHLGDVSPPMQM